MANSKGVKYVCNSCGGEFLKWSGKCGNCGEWDSLEEVQDISVSRGGVTAKRKSNAETKSISKYVGKKTANTDRMSSGINEFDRVLGGGFVPGEVVLIGGHPGIGKSTLLSQVALLMASGGRVLYVSGEESVGQLLSRLKRLDVFKDDLLDNIDVIDSIIVEDLQGVVENGGYDLVIVDSIQSVRSELSTSFPGSISQVRAAGDYLVTLAKATGIPFVIVGQINKDGNIAGPKVLEHLVDCVMYLEGDMYEAYRVLRGIKNRFGSTNEIGVFEMLGVGMREVANPSEVFLLDNESTSGSALTAVVRGSRVVIVEVQALVVERDGGGGPMRRVANGYKSQRLEMLVAVLSRFGGLRMGDRDVFVNVVGGVNLDDPGADLAVCAAIMSSYKDKKIDGKSVFVGEVGLTGSVRKVFGMDKVVSEISRLGYKDIFLPTVDISGKGLNLNYVDSVSRLLK